MRRAVVTVRAVISELTYQLSSRQITAFTLRFNFQNNAGFSDQARSHPSPHFRVLKGRIPSDQRNLNKFLKRERTFKNIFFLGQNPKHKGDTGLDML